MHEIELSEARFSFTVMNCTQLESLVFSPTVFIRKLPWQMQIGPNPAVAETRPMEMRLFCNKDSKSTSWSCNAMAEFIILPINRSQQAIIRKFQTGKLFYSKKNNWGFSKFLDWKDILKPERGYILDDKITIEVYISADEPIGVPWKSRKDTGFVGLKSRLGHSCMNAMLQMLFCIQDFCGGICETPIESNDHQITFALQRLFQNLRTSEGPVEIKQFIDSFEDSFDLINIKDTQAFFKILIDTVKKENPSSLFVRIFEGKIFTSFAYAGSDMESDAESIILFTNSKLFVGIHLEIRSNTNIYESFNDFLVSKASIRKKRTNASGRIMQNTCSTAKFTQLPPVLILHLDNGNMGSAENIKSFEFGDEINLNKYCQNTIETPSNYILHSVLVRTDNNQFVAFIKPNNDDKWLKFDYDVVSNCTIQEAIQENYEKACMLIYVHKLSNTIGMDGNGLQFTCHLSRL